MTFNQYNDLMVNFKIKFDYFVTCDLSVCLGKQLCMVGQDLLGQVSADHRIQTSEDSES